MIFFIFIYLFNSFVHASSSNLESDCRAKIQISNAAELLNIPNCKLAMGLATNPDVEEYHRHKVYEKLSAKLALQIQQSLEENALIAQYYSMGKKELLQEGKSDVKNECRLENLNSIETCNGKKNLSSPSYNLRLHLLKNNLKVKSTCADKTMSLQDILRGRVLETLGASSQSSECQPEKKHCPISGESGAFTLKAQLDQISAENLIAQLKDPSDKSETINTFFEEYPQFKLIKNSKSSLKNDFENYLKGYKKGPVSEKKYIDNFFFNNDNNQTKILETLASQCKDVNKNIKTFLCSPDLEGTQLASLDEKTSTDLFGLNPNNTDNIFRSIKNYNKEIFYSAYGFQCLAKEKSNKSSNNKNSNIVEEKNTLDNWFKDFSKNVRSNPDSNEEQIESEVGKFCSIYNCEAKSVKMNPACKDGGPLSFNKFQSIFACDKNECSTDILKYMTYLEGIEQIKQIQISSPQNKTSHLANNINASQAPSPRLSAFLENYLGAKGTLLAEGKEITPLAIAEKTKEISERKPELTSATNSLPTKLAEQKPAQFAGNTSLTASPEKSETEFSNKIATVQSDQFDSSINANSAALKRQRSSSVKSVAAEKSIPNGFLPESDRDAEIKKMRAELESITSSMKGSDAEKLKAMTDVNSRFSPTSLGGSTKAEISKGLSETEQLRNDQYQKNLASWESRLRNWQNDLTDREIRGPSNTVDSTSSKRADSNEPSSRSARNDGQIQLNSSENSGSGINAKSKLSKAGTPVGAPVGAENGEAIVSSEDLANLKLEALNDLGIDTKSAFIMKIKHQQKYYNVPVKTFYDKVRGKNILVPVLNESNSSISRIILESPIFSEYKQLQIERQKERQEFAQLNI
ncbi:MAG: hypothetical protein Q7U04_13525 [Bacteriovorax sp.]|nr:hypothetical protein [Bacteriovorax sp.]